MTSLAELQNLYRIVLDLNRENDQTFGVIKESDHENGLVSVETKNGLRLLRIEELYDVMCMEELVSKKF